MASLAAVTLGVTNIHLRGISINPVTTGDAAITLVASDSGIMCVNKLASTTTYTLPACSLGAGKFFRFYCGVANNIVVTSPTAATLYGPAALGITCTLTGAIGSCMDVIGDGTYWYIIPCYGTTAIT